MFRPLYANQSRATIELYLSDAVDVKYIDVKHHGSGTTRLLGEMELDLLPEQDLDTQFQLACGVQHAGSSGVSGDEDCQILVQFKFGKVLLCFLSGDKDALTASHKLRLLLGSAISNLQSNLKSTCHSFNRCVPDLRS